MKKKKRKKKKNNNLFPINNSHNFKIKINFYG